MITRDTILDLVQQTRREGNENLGDLLLVIVGMIEPNGEVSGEPHPNEPWHKVNALSGAWGRGLMLMRERQRKSGNLAVSGVIGVVDPSRTKCVNCAGVGPCVFPKADQPERDAMGCLSKEEVANA